MDNPEEISLVVERPELCLLLSSMHCRYEEHKEYLSSFNVDLIVDLSGNKDLNINEGIDNLRFDVLDSERQCLSPVFAAVYEAIETRMTQASAQTRVLVHCQQGISRSAAVVLYLLMRLEHMALKDAFRHLKRRRRIILPNTGFLGELIDAEMQLFGKATLGVGGYGQILFL